MRAARAGIRAHLGMPSAPKAGNGCPTALGLARASECRLQNQLFLTLRDRRAASDYSTFLLITVIAPPSTTPRVSLPLLTITKCWKIGAAPGVGMSTADPVQSGFTV
jgi:hypothetical protein